MRSLTTGGDNFIGGGGNLTTGGENLTRGGENWPRKQLQTPGNNSFKRY